MLAELIGRPSWMADAACQESSLDFVPPRGTTPAAMAALRAVCADCLCLKDCLAFALEDETLQGVWAGTTAQQRKRLRQEAGPRPIVLVCDDCGGNFTAMRRGVLRCGPCNVARRQRANAEGMRRKRSAA